VSVHLRTHLFSLFSLCGFRKHARQYRERVHEAICVPRPSNAIVSVKGSEQGKLLLCAFFRYIAVFVQFPVLTVNCRCDEKAI